MIAHRTLAALSTPQYTLVLLHAFPLSSKMWDRASAALQSLRDDVEVVLIDLPGFGQSPIQDPWSIEGAAREIRELLRTSVSKRIVLGGLSMGGYVALRFYRDYGSMLRGLILCDTKAEGDTEAQKRIRSQFAKDALERGPQAAIDRLYAGFVSEETEPEIAVDILGWMREADPKAIAAALLAMRERQDSTDLLPLVSIPALVIVGERDATCPPEQMRYMASKIANSSFDLIDSASHLSAVEKPMEWAEAVSSFLDRIPT
jgi:pimeloyl-ACP methyl ester carboxylesterase